MTLDLAAIGWNERLNDAFRDHAAAGVVPGRVTREHTHIYAVATADRERLARVAGRLRHDASARADFPAVGDWVALELPPHGGDARIRAVLPRHSRFSRRAAGDVTEEQVVASNIDTIFLVAGLDHDFNPRRLERYLLVGWESGAMPVVVLNKADLVPNPDELAERIGQVIALAPGVPVHAVSSRQPETLEALRQHLGFGRTGALLGSSGVGKSSIVNRLIGHELLPTRDVRESDSRGRHASTYRQLVILPGGGVLIDTPGMREIQLWDSGELSDTFADIAEIADGCRFRDCRHQSEPGCAVIAAVEAGDLPANRLDSFRKLAAEQAHSVRQQDERALLERKRQGKVGAKALRKHLKTKHKS